ncbi:MAG: pilus assembly protein PilM, partial [Candidatus Omnitrophica bacterium]|nr:pilus assembly protein PilM [Candidatus Omnitrophota bacterium]
HGVPGVAFDPKDKVAIAEEIMRQKYEASLESGTPLEGQINQLELRLLWQPHIEKIAQEVRRSMVFYEEQSEGKRIGGIFFIGGGVGLKNFLEAVRALIGMPCEAILPFADLVHHIPAGNTFKDELCATSLFAGAASLSAGVSVSKTARESQVNFLPVELKQREAVAMRRFVFLTIAFVSIIVLLVLTLQAYIMNQRTKARLKQMVVKLEKVRNVSQGLKQLELAQRKINDRDRVINELVKARRDIRRPLSELAAAVSDEILLERCVATGNKLELTGLVVADYEGAQASVLAFRRRLERVPFFANISLSEFDLEEMVPEVERGAGGQLSLTRPRERRFILITDIVEEQ